MKNRITTPVNKTVSTLTILVFAIISMFSIGCTPTPTPTPSCNTSNTIFHQIYTNVATASGNTDIVTYDLNVHEYDFKVSANKIICSVGYQSQPAVAALPYKIEIIDNTTSTTLYNNSAVFSSTVTSYVSVPNITVVPGHNYTVRRTLVNYLGNVGNTIGRMAKSTSSPTIAFPNAVGALTITASRFYQAGSTPTTLNLGIPFIDIAFQ